MLGFLISCFSLALSLFAVRLSWHTHRLRHIDGVSLHLTDVEGELSEENHPEVVLRNDGAAAIAYQNVFLAYGRRSVAHRQHPEGWGLLNLRVGGVLAPGEERRFPRPDDPIGVGIIGPVAIVDDAAGQRWYITPGAKVRHRPEDKPLRRRDAWFERRKWWAAHHKQIEIWAAKLQTQRPGMLPVVPLLIDFLWGWRAGLPADPFGPRRQPIGWRYARSEAWTRPKVPNMPTYCWRPDEN